MCYLIHQYTHSKIKVDIKPKMSMIRKNLFGIMIIASVNLNDHNWAMLIVGINIIKSGKIYIL